jgi:hypothetical protein
VREGALRRSLVLTVQDSHQKKWKCESLAEVSSTREGLHWEVTAFRVQCNKDIYGPGMALVAINQPENALTVTTPTRPI